MNRSRTALAVTVLALAFLGACGQRDASQSSVQNKVEDFLTNEDDRPDDQLYPGAPLDAADAAGAAACVAQGLFDPNSFEKDDRNDVTQSADADLPSAAVTEAFEALVEDCVDEATAAPAQGPSVDEDEGETDTTERQSSNDEGN